MALARICAGGVQQCASLPQTVSTQTLLHHDAQPPIKKGGSKTIVLETQPAGRRDDRAAEHVLWRACCAAGRTCPARPTRLVCVVQRYQVVLAAGVRVENKNPATWAGSVTTLASSLASMLSFVVQFSLRRLAKQIPAKARPRSASEPGSGTGVPVPV